MSALRYRGRQRRGPRFVLNMGNIAQSQAFMNFAKSLGSQALASAGSYAYPGAFDANEHFNPAGGTLGAEVFSTLATGSLPTLGGTVDWVLKWSGTARVRLDRGAPGFSVVSQSPSGVVQGTTGFNMDVSGTDVRVVFKWVTNQTSNLTVRFLTTGTFSGFSNFTLCRLSDEAALDGGGVYTPEFLAEIAALRPKVLRFLDWSPINAAIPTTFSHRRPVSALSYVNPRYITECWAGTTSGTDNYTLSAPSGWGGLVDGAIVQFQIGNANTSTSCTLDVGGSGAKTITLIGGANPTVGGSFPLSANRMCSAVYDAALDNWIWSHGSLGINYQVPIEHQVRLCNETGCDYWFEWPAMVTDASAAEYIEYIRDNLNSNLNCYVEYGNEIWNENFPITTWAKQRGGLHGFTADNNRYFQSFYALKFRQLMEIAGTAWSPRSSSQLKRTLACQAVGGTPNETYRFLGTDLVAGRSYSQTVSISVATPAVVSGISGASPLVGYPVTFTTTGTLPTGLSPSTTYYVSTTSWSTTSFRLSTSYANAIAGVNIATTGAGSGTHTMTYANTTYSGGTYNASPNRPIDYCDVLAPAWYMSGAQVKSIDAEFTALNIDAFISAATDYATADPALMEAALDWIDNDIRQGLLSTSALASTTVKYFNDTTGAQWAGWATTYGKTVAAYEMAIQIGSAAPTDARLTALGKDGTKGTACRALIEAYKNTDRFKETCKLSFNNFVGLAGHSYPCWYNFCQTGGGAWTLFTTSIENTPYKSYDAIAEFNS